MASALTVIPAATGAPRAFSGGEPQSEGAEGFAALLGGTAAPAITSASSATRSSDGGPLDLMNLVRLAFGFGAAGEDAEGEEPEAADPLAAVVAAPSQPLDAATEAKLTEFVDSLAALKSALDAGEPIAPELIDTLDTLLGELGAALGLDLDALAAGGPPGGAGDETDLVAQLAALLGPLGQELAGQAPTQADAAAIDAARRLGVRLEALANALSGAADAELPAALQNGVAVSGALRQAIERLVQSAAGAAEAVPEEPELAAPALKLSEPVLTGKPAGDSATAPPVVAAVEADEQKNTPARPEPSPERPVRTPEPTGLPPMAGGPEQPASAAAVAVADTSLRVEAPAQPRIVQAGYQTSQQQLNLPQLAFEIVRQVNDGNTRFQIRLDPPELGKIDVRLDIDRSGQVTARLTVEKAETLDLMQRDQRGLERALQQAGLDGQKTNLEFSLKQNPFAGQGNPGQDGQGQGRGRFGTSGVDADDEPQPTVNLYRGSLTASGVNIIA